MTDTFISYSRSDSEFVRKLFKVLQASGRDPWVDWEGIASAAPDFLAEIFTAIEAADTFLLIMTPSSLKSEICNLEIAHALEHHKRVVPLVHIEVMETGKLAGAVVQQWYGSEWEEQARKNWETLSHINWLFFRSFDDFDDAFNGLITTLDTDLDHVKFHTRLTVRAREWKDQQRSDDFVLRGDDLTTAEGWLAISQNKEPSPTPLQQDYVEASVQVRERDQAEAQQQQARELELQKAATRRLRYLLGAAITFLVIAVGLTIFAFGQQKSAQRRAEESQSLLWAGEALKAQEVNNLDLAIALALQANKLSNPPLVAQQALADVAYAPGTISRFEGHTNWVSSVAVSPNGTSTVSGSYDQTVILWDIQSGRQLHRFSGHSDAITDVDLSPDGQTILSTSHDGTLRLWDINQDREIRQLHFNDVGILSAEYSPDGQQIISGSADGTILLWDVTTGDVIRSFDGLTTEIWTVKFSPDGQQIVSGAADGTLLLWDIAATEAIMGYGQETTSILSAAFSPDGKVLLSGGDDGDIVLWDIESGEEIRRLEGHTSWVLSMEVSSDGQTIISSSADRSIRFWDFSTGTELRRFLGHTDEVMDVAFLDTNHAISASRDQTLRFWDLINNEQLQTLTGHTASVRNVANSADGTAAVSFSDDGLVNVWEIQNSSLIGSLAGHHAAVLSGDISPDGLILSGGGSIGYPLILWDLISMQEVRRLYGHTNWITSIDFVDSTHAISGSLDHTMILWDTQSESPLIQRLVGHTLEVTDIAISPGGLIAASSSLDNNLILWDLQTGQEIRRLGTLASDIYSVAFSYDGRFLLSGYDDGNVILWQLRSLDELMEWVYSNRYIYELTADERIKYRFDE